MRSRVMEWATGAERRRMVVTLPVLFIVGVVTAVYVQHRDAYRDVPVFATVPSSLATVAGVRNFPTGKSCWSSDGLGHPRVVSAHTWVDPDPTGGRALWLPGLNARPCRAVLTRLNGDQALRFAAAVDRSPPPPSGLFACGMDDASSVTVFLTYPGQADAEVVRVFLTGCGGISAPGRDRRAWSDDALAALEPIPRGWAAIVGSGPTAAESRHGGWPLLRCEAC